MNNNSTNNLFLNQKVVQTATNYTVLANDVIIEVTSTAAPRTITLPSPSANNSGKFYIIKDTSGNAGTNNISIVPSSGTIDGLSSTSMQTNYGALQVYSDGTNYYSQGLWVNPSAYNPGTWFSYTPTTTGLVLGNSTMTAYYLQIGKVLFIQLTITGGSTSGPGSGGYTWSLPTGFTINTAITSLAVPGSSIFPPIGSAFATQLSNRSNGVGSPATATTFYIYIQSPYGQAVGNGNYNFSSGTVYSASLQIPIV